MSGPVHRAKCTEDTCRFETRSMSFFGAERHAAIHMRRTHHQVALFEGDRLITVLSKVAR